MSRPTLALSIFCLYRTVTYYGYFFQKYSNLFLLKDWPGPHSLVTTNGISVDFFSSGYLDISVLQVRFLELCIHSKMSSRLDGFPHSEIHGSIVIDT